LLKTLHKKTDIKKKPIFTKLKERFEHIELPAKLLDYFLRSNKININSKKSKLNSSPNIITL